MAPMSSAFVILAAWLMADFLAGVVHWLQDRVLRGPSRIALINNIWADNELHHVNPGFMVQSSYWANINTTVIFTWPLVVVLVLVGAPHVVSLAVFFTSFGNLVHRFAHTHPIKLNMFIQFMQWTGLFITLNHHVGHHMKGGRLLRRKDARIRYCPMTTWLNPILDFVGFFRMLDRVFVRDR